jgi:HSP20 family molecular chaperone IbpA
MNTLTPFRFLSPLSSLSLPRMPWTGDLEQLWNRFTGEDGGTRASTRVPPMDVLDQAGAYLVKVELPGLKSEDIRIECTGNTLSIHGESKQEQKKEDEHYRLLERSYGAFERSLTFPTDVDSSHVDAELKDGVLSVRVAKAKAAKTTKIAVKQAK